VAIFHLTELNVKALSHHLLLGLAAVLILVLEDYFYRWFDFNSRLIHNDLKTYSLLIYCRFEFGVEKQKVKPTWMQLEQWFEQRLISFVVNNATISHFRQKSSKRPKRISWDVLEEKFEPWISKLDFINLARKCSVCHFGALLISSVVWPTQLSATLENFSQVKRIWLTLIWCL